MVLHVEETVREVEEERCWLEELEEFLLTWLLFITAPPPPLPKGMQGFAEGSTIPDPTRIPDPCAISVVNVMFDRPGVAGAVLQTAS